MKKLNERIIIKKVSSDNINENKQLMKLIYTMNRRYLILLFLILNGVLLKAQDDKIMFGAYARAFQTQNQISPSDTLNPNRNTTGHLLIDLGVNINPDKKTEIQAIMRFKSEMAGFYGAGVSAMLRQAFIRGIIGKFLNYQVGDLYLQLSPYTFYNNNAEGQVNEATIFRDIRRDYTNYENFSYRGNAWWQQGVHTDFAIDFPRVIKNIRIDGFFLRNRANYLTIPSTFHAGGRALITQSDNLKLAVNYVNLFQLASTVGTTNEYDNPVTSLELDFNVINNSATELKLFGEGGYSELSFKGDSLTSNHDKKGGFIDGGMGLTIKPARLGIKASYMYVDPQFFSAAVQTKRVNFAKNPTLYPNYGNDPFNPYQRSITIFDLVRDTAVYNQVIRPQLMSYNPALNNSQPYGKATPNRTGLNLGITWKDSLERVVVDLSSAYLMEVVAAGGSDKRKFLVGKAAVDLNINKMIGFKKRLIITTGYRYEKTNRGGTAPVNLTSRLIDLGLDVEVLKKLDVLVGSKMLIAKGNEYMIVRNNLNDIVGYDNSMTNNINISQNLLAFGLKYRFTDRTYLTVQDNIFQFKDKTHKMGNYSINQVLIMFNMNF